MKKVLSLALALVLVFGMASVAFAASSKITGVADEDNIFVELPTIDANNETLNWDNRLGSLGVGEIGPQSGRKIKIYLNPNSFDWSGDIPVSKYGATDKFTIGMLDDAKVKVSLDAKAKDKKVIDKVELKTEQIRTNKENTGSPTKATVPYVQISFVDQYVGVDDIEFDFNVKLTVRGATKDSVNIYGTYCNDSEIVEDGQTDADSSGGVVLEPESVIRNIEVHGGDNFYAKVNMSSNKKYYFTAEVDVKDEDIEVLERYPEMAYVYYINQVNMKFSGNCYYFQDLDDKYYVYNDEGRLIGTTEDMLPFSTKYFLATEKVAVGSSPSEPKPGLDDNKDPEPEPEPQPQPQPEPEPQLPPTSSGSTGGGYYDNDNQNPNTGVNGLVNVAVVAGVVALAAAGAVSLKK